MASWVAREVALPTSTPAVNSTPSVRPPAEVCPGTHIAAESDAQIVRSATVKPTPMCALAAANPPPRFAPRTKTATAGPTLEDLREEVRGLSYDMAAEVSRAFTATVTVTGCVPLPPGAARHNAEVP